MLEAAADLFAGFPDIGIPYFMSAAVIDPLQIIEVKYSDTEFRNCSIRNALVHLFLCFGKCALALNTGQRILVCHLHGRLQLFLLLQLSSQTFFHQLLLLICLTLCIQLLQQKNNDNREQDGHGQNDPDPVVLQKFGKRYFLVEMHIGCQCRIHIITAGHSSSFIQDEVQFPVFLIHRKHQRHRFSGRNREEFILLQRLLNRRHPVAADQNAVCRFVCDCFKAALPV